MDEDPEPVPQQTRPLLADIGSLIDMGVVDEQPQPPTELPPDPPAEEAANAAALTEALAEAGIPAAGADEQAIAALAKLDPAMVEAITRWMLGDSAGAKK